MPTKPTTPNAALVALLRPPAGVQSAGRRAFMLLKSLEAVYGIAVGEGDFGARVFEPLWSGAFADMSDADLESMLDELATSDPDVGAEHVSGVAVFVAAAYAVRAMRADKAGDQLSAWRAVADASAWTAFVDARISFGEGAERVRSRKEWTLKPLQRERDVVAAELHKYLARQLTAGSARPTARQVLEEWMAAKPTAFQYVTQVGVRFVNGEGDMVLVGPDDLRDRIRRMAPFDDAEDHSPKSRRAKGVKAR